MRIGWRRVCGVRVVGHVGCLIVVWGRTNGGRVWMWVCVVWVCLLWVWLVWPWGRVGGLCGVGTQVRRMWVWVCVQGRRHGGADCGQSRDRVWVWVWV